MVVPPRLAWLLASGLGILLLSAAGMGLHGLLRGYAPLSPLTFVSSENSHAHCPEGYVWVSADSGNFCVMKHGARAFDQVAGRVVEDGCGGLGDLAQCNRAGLNNWADRTRIVPMSVPEGVPWRRVSFLEAERACEGLGGGYRLITNRQWMAIARDLELTPANWASGVPGVGTMAKGLHKTGEHPEGLYKRLGHPAPATTAACLYGFVLNDEIRCAPRGAFAHRRTLELSTGDILWDFAGNMWEWVDATEDGDTLPGRACSNRSGWTAFDECDFKGSSPFVRGDEADPRFDVAPELSGGIASGVGMIHSHNEDDRVFRRGGSWHNGPASGVFALDLRSSPFDASAGIGFRCVFEPSAIP